jgi:chromate transport protein ChrA
MKPRVKKLVGGVVLVAFVVVYALVVMIVGQVRMAQASGLAQLAFFAVFGLIWVIPAALLIRWMERVDRRP